MPIIADNKLDENKNSTDTNSSENNVIKIKTGAQYIKDLSFENPTAPQIYTEQKITPKINVSIDINGKKIGDNTYEVELLVKANSKYDDKNMFIIELVYAGIFSIENVTNEDSLKQILFIYCPSLLFPYARRIISDTTRDASFPPLILDTIDFKTLYESRKDSKEI